MYKRKSSKYPNFIYEDMYCMYMQQKIAVLTLVLEELAESTYELCDWWQ